MHFYLLCTVFPGFKTLGPSKALGALNTGSALNTGTTKLIDLEIVSKLKVDLKNPENFEQKGPEKRRPESK